LKVLLYFEGIEKISRSAIGKALLNQQKALDSVGIEYTLDPDDDYDILHINTVLLNSEPIISKARKKGAAIIYHAHTTEEDFKNSFIFSNMISKVFKERLKVLYRKGDCVVAPTQYVRDLLQGYGISVPIEVVSNGVDTNEFVFDEDKSNKFRNYLGFTKEDKIVVATGPLIKRKGIIDFIKVAELLPDIKFVWIGDTSILSVPIELHNVINSEHPDNVYFPGELSDELYKGALSACDIFFSPTYEERENISLLESLSCSCTALVRDIPVFDDWLQHGVNCFKATTNEEFARIIRDKTNGELLDVSSFARHTAEERSIEHIGRKLKLIYEATQEDVITSAIRKFAKENYGDRKLHIGLFSDTYYPDVNGVSVSIETLRKQLLKMGHVVYVITASLDTKIVGGVEFENGVLRIPAVKIKQLYGYRISRPISIHALEYIKNMDLDVIHINTEFTIRMIAVAAAHLFKIPYCFTSHTMWEDYTHYITKGHFDKTSKKMVGMYTKHVYDGDCEIIVPSKKTQGVLQTYGIKKQIHVVPTGIDTARLSPENVDSSSVDEILTSLNIKDKFRIVYVGRLAQEKNLDFIINNLPAVFQRHPDAVMLITGYGPSEDDFKQLVNEKGLSDKVFFLGKQPPDKIQNYYALGELFVTASTSETQGLTYIEAMAAGLPVIAKYDNVLTDVLVDKVTGYFFDTSDEFIDAVDRFRNMTSEERKKMKENALAKAEEYSLETFGDKITKVYYRAIRKNTVKRANKKD